MPVLAKFFSPIEKPTSCYVFASKRLFNCREDLFIVFKLMPTRQTLSRHTGTPPVRQSDELSILIRFSVITSVTVSKRLLFVTSTFLQGCAAKGFSSFSFTLSTYTPYLVRV